MKKKGFTLIELMMVLMLTAIVLTLAVPSFQNIISSNRLTTQVNEFVSALNLARSEAIKRGVRVTLCKSADGTTCTNTGGYDQGWIVFSDLNDNADFDDNESSDEELIRVVGNLGNKISITGNRNVAKYISFISSGTSQLINGGFQAGTITLCQEQDGRNIIINRIGRIRTQETTCLNLLPYF